jgi:hypothetical protein
MTRPAETNDALKDAEPLVHQDVPAAQDTQVVQTSARASSIAADRDHDESGLDAASGCEFVDDRIRSLD